MSRTAPARTGFEDVGGRRRCRSCSTHSSTAVQRILQLMQHRNRKRNGRATERFSCVEAAQSDILTGPKISVYRLGGSIPSRATFKARSLEFTWMQRHALLFCGVAFNGKFNSLLVVALLRCCVRFDPCLLRMRNSAGNTCGTTMRSSGWGCVARGRRRRWSGRWTSGGWSGRRICGPGQRRIESGGRRLDGSSGGRHEGRLWRRHWGNWFTKIQRIWLTSHYEHTHHITDG